MISQIHEADEHAPFPHYTVTVVGKEPELNAQGKPIGWIEYVSVHLVCAICKHYISPTYRRTGCHCRATCHDVFVIESAQVSNPTKGS